MVKGEVVDFLGVPVKIPDLGEGLAESPDMPLERKIEINNIIELAKLYGFFIYIILLIIYIGMEIRNSRVRRAAR